MESDTDDAFDLADHVVATSESEPPEETVTRLFGTPDPQTAVAAQETVAQLFAATDGVPDSGTDDEGAVACCARYLLDPDGETRHEIHVGERVDYAQCVDGALIAAELADGDSATVRSLDPVSCQPVTFDVSGADVAVAPDGAVVSMGMADSVPASANMLSFGIGMVTGESDPEAHVDDPLDVFCTNFNAFESVETYEEWAAGADAVSVAVPAPTFGAMIRHLVSGPGFD